MELDLTAVKTAFSHYSGETADEEGSGREALCGALCVQCARLVQGQMRPGLTEEEFSLWKSSLEELAGAEAFYQLLLTEEAVTPQSLTAGELKLTEGGRSEKAAVLAAEKRKAASPALLETAFYFGRVGKEEEHVSAE